MRNSLLRLKKLWAGLIDPAYRHALRRGVGASIEHTDALVGLDFDLVVDVGANRGQFALFARRHFPRCRIIAFEPLKEPAAVFEAIFKDDAQTRLVKTAVSAARGSLAIYVTGEDDCSSALKVAEAQSAAFGTVIVETRDVPCGRLSDLIQGKDLGARNLLKIDTQGTELEVLKGAADILDRFQAVYCEVSYVELYVGQALAPEIIAYLGERGLHLAGAFNTQANSRFGPLQADMLFLRGGAERPRMPALAARVAQSE